MYTRRGHAEVALEVCLGGCAAVDFLIVVDECQILPLQGSRARLVHNPLRSSRRRGVLCLLNLVQVIRFEALHAKRPEAARLREDSLCQRSYERSPWTLRKPEQKRLQLEEALPVRTPSKLKGAHMLARALVRRACAGCLPGTAQSEHGSVHAMASVDARHDLIPVMQPLCHEWAVNVLSRSLVAWA